jgi:ubiquinone/menaquinone biosynthesis C-methylase UbiE
VNADPIAAAYRWVEYLAFGRTLERCRYAHIEKIPADSRVLILGEGDGRFLAALLPRLSAEASVDVIESSAKMIALAKRRVSSHAGDRVQFYHNRDRELHVPQSGYDVVVTNFFLDCLSRSEAAALIRTATDRLQSGGLWVVGEFHVPERGLRRWHARLWIHTMYRFFRMTTGLKVRTIPDYAKLLRTANFTQRNRLEQRYGLVVAELWQKRSHD